MERGQTGDELSKDKFGMQEVIIDFLRHFSSNKELERSSKSVSTFGVQMFFLPLSLFKYGNFVDNLRLFTRGGSGGMGYPRLGGEGGKGGDVWVVAHKKMTLKQLKDKYPQKRFVAGEGANSR